jgi:beta-N-acetylhexosaminidase
VLRAWRRSRKRNVRPHLMASMAGGMLISGLTACGSGLGTVQPLPSLEPASVTTASGATTTAKQTPPPGPVISGGPTGGSAPNPKASVHLSLDRAVGQMLMSHVTGLQPSSRLLGRIRAGQVGSVILYSENVESNAQLANLDATLQQTAREGGNPPLFIATDQEGGEVKRVPSAPPTMSAQQMGASANPSVVARRQGRATGVYLRRLGINLDLAPVSDIPTTANNFLRERAFGHTQASVIAGASGFALGLAEAHIAGAVKHFPGLGAAGPRDTDLEVVSIAASKAELQSGYKPYIYMSRLGSDVAPLVMISNALYPHLDPSGLPADLSQKIVGEQLALAGMSGRVVITDDMEVPSVQRYTDAPVLAVQAGDDILMFAQRESGSEDAYSAIKAAVAAGTLSRSLIIAAANRVIELKEKLGVG